MLRDDELLVGGVVEHPPLVPLWIAQENALFHVRLEAFPLVLLHIHIGSAPKYSDLAQIWFLPVPGFMGGPVR